MCQITLTPIATIHTPFKEKFSTPRQPGLASAARGEVVFEAAYQSLEYIRGLDQFSHIWLLFQFHQSAKASHPPLVRPPRLGGNKKIGVFASRSTHRPNNIGMSVVKLEKINVQGQVASLLVSGVDLVDGTPIVDIKPYVPYSDALSNASAGYAQQSPESLLTVQYEQNAQQQLLSFEQKLTDLELLIRQVLAQDPRPAYRQKEQSERVYGVRLHHLNIQWVVRENTCWVIDISVWQATQTIN